MNSHGVILMVTLWILAILIVFVLGLGFRMSLEAKLTDYNIREMKNLYLAKAALNKLKAVLLEDDTPRYDSLNEDWSNDEGLFKDVMLQEGSFTISYIRTEGPTEKTFYGAIDETSKININTAPRDILLRLPGITEDIADSILDWRDTDDIPHEDGAEGTYYRSLDFPYDCKNGPFQSKEELLLVKEVTPEILDGIRDMITIYGEGKINFNTADSRVMETLGLTEDSIDAILKYRAGGDEEEGTDDDVVFMSVNDIKEKPGLTNDEKVRITNLSSAGLIGVTADYFRLHITAKTKDGRIIKDVQTVISRSGEEDGVKFWYED